MGTISSYEKILRETSPAAYTAVHVFADDYLNKAKEYEQTGREIIEDAGKIVHGRAGEVFSDGVHKGADWGGKAAGAATGGLILAAGAALGGLVGGPIGAALGAWLVSGVAGAIGGAVTGMVSGIIESVGRFVAGIFGIDFHSHGKTSGGGTWDKTDFAAGGWERHERGQSFDVDEMMGANGSFSQNITGKGAHSGYKSHFSDNGRGGSHFEAVDRGGIFHNSNTDSSGSAWGSTNSHDRDKSNGKDGKHVGTQGSDGSKSDLWFYNDGSSKESHTSAPQRNPNGTVTTNTTETEKDKDGKTTHQTSTSTTKDDQGNTTTVTTTTDGDGKSSTKTESKDSQGNTHKPPQPPPGNSSGRDNPDGEGSEGPPFRPGEMGKGRPGHPFDDIVPPGSWKNDSGEWQNEQPPQYRDMLAGMVLILDPFAYTGHGDAADEQAKREDLRRKLKGMEVTKQASGEDFIHPKAKAALLGHMMRSAI